MTKKIIELDELAKIVSRLKSEGKKIVHCHGVFDLLHVGHIRHLKAARKFGDVLVVTVTQDKYVGKGPHRPAFTEKLRAEAISALGCVDYVAINKWPLAVETIKLLKPDFYAKGVEYSEFSDDYTKGIIAEKDIVEKMGGKIIFTDEITFSSSSLINKYLHIFPKETSDYLTSFSKKYTPEDIINYLEKIHDLRVLVIGDAIIDEYQYGFPIGKSGKEPIIALKYLDTDSFLGGAFAVANHVANFCNEVTLLTFLGDKDSKEDFISENLNRKIRKIFFYKENSPTTIKRRYIDKSGAFIKKLLEFYVFNDEEIKGKQIGDLLKLLEEILPTYDLVIVADFGHGMINKEMRDLIIKKSVFLAVNTQTNAGNMGFNTISKYPGANYICIDEPEIRFDVQSKEGKLLDLIREVTLKLFCKKIIITRGTKGCISASVDEENKQVLNYILHPPFSDKVVDRMGAGDAFFSITAPLVALGTPMEIVGFVGNAVGSMACTIIGNKESIEKISLYKYVRALLK